MVNAQKNLITNPGFESASAKQGLPGGGWWLSQTVGETKVSVDDTVAHGGHASVRMESSAKEKCVLVSRKFDVSPGDGVRFSVWARGANLPAGLTTTYAGLAFRNADNKILERHYAVSGSLGGQWSLLSGAAQAPAGAVTAELHLGYTNAPGTIWYDDATAVITNPISLYLTEGAQPWPGPQEITVRVANRQPTALQARVVAQIGRAEKSVSIALGPEAAGNFKLPITLNGVGQHAYKISLLDSTGAAVRTIQGKFKTSPPLALFPPCPCYHAIGGGNGDTLIDARVNIDPARRAGLKLSVTVFNPGGQSIQNVEAPVSPGEFAEVRVAVPVSAAGVFDVVGRIVDGEGRAEATGKADIHVIAPEEARVQLGPDGFLRVAGKSEFPIGLYNSSFNAEMAGAGFNATHDYDVTTGNAAEKINPTEPVLKELLDKSWANGMRMMVELPREAIEKGQWEQVRRRIVTFRHHPGLLCWGSEERVARGQAKPANIAALYALVRELDPDHPLVLGDSRDVIEKFEVDRSDFFPDDSMDIGIWWWYPIPMLPSKGGALEGSENTGDVMEPPSWLTTTHSRKPLWIAIQSYQKPAKDARFPTPTEYRAQAYLSIINGVKGLFFYTGSGQRDFADKPSGILNKPELGHWDYVKQLVGELRDFSPVIMAPPAAASLQLTPTNAMVEFTTRELDGKVYLIAANKSDHPQKARWQGELLRDKKAATLFENHPGQLNGDTLADDFSPYAVHVYRFD